MPITFGIDTLGRPAAENGEFLCLKASAYDTCVMLGQDPAYQRFTELPQKVVDYYDATGYDVIEWAAKGWMRGREFNMRDPWQKFVAPDRGRKGTRSRTTANVSESDLATRRALENGPDTWFSAPAESSTRKPHGEGLRAPVTDADKVLLTDAVIKDLSVDLRRELREHLQPYQWKPLKRGTEKVCRTVAEVRRACRVTSTGNTTHAEVIGHLLHQEVSRMVRPVTVHSTDTL